MFADMKRTVLLVVLATYSDKAAANMKYGNGTYIAPEYAEDLGYALQVNHTVCGVGNQNSFPTINFAIGAYGILDSLCINGGKEEPPGQNSPAPSVDGFVNGLANMETGGCVDFMIIADGTPDDGAGCCGYSCEAGGVCTEDITFRQKGVTYTIEGCDVGELCCQEGDPDGVCPPECSNCRVHEGSEDCPNTKNWDQIVSGTKFNSFVIDSWTIDVNDNIKEVERLVCTLDTASLDGPLTVDNANCVACEICAQNGNPSNCDVNNNIERCYCQVQLAGDQPGTGDWPALHELCPPL